MAMDANKQKALEMAIKQIDKTFGKGTLMRLGDKEIEPIAAISTGVITSYSIHYTKLYEYTVAIDQKWSSD